MFGASRPLCLELIVPALQITPAAPTCKTIALVSRITRPSVPCVSSDRLYRTFTTAKSTSKTNSAILGLYANHGLFTRNTLARGGMCRQEIRLYSSDDESKADVRGFFVRLPNPVHWAKNLFFSFYIQNWVDPLFSLREFERGAKQALSYLTRLTVLKDFNSMKAVASEEVISKMKDLVSPWSDEQQQSIEILVSDISLASANITSVVKEPDSTVNRVEVDIFCVALKSYKARPLLIQMTLRFSRLYEAEQNPSDWRIVRILAFTVREMLKEEHDELQK